MRVLFTADLQLGSGAGYGTEAEPRLRDNSASLDSIATMIEEHAVTYLVIAGDVFQHRRPAIDELLLFSTWLDALPCEVVLVAGNHDVRGPNLPTTVDLFAYRENVSVFTRPDVMRLVPPLADGPDVMLGVLPWAHPGNMRAALRDELERAGTVEREELLLRVAEGLALEPGVDARAKRNEPELAACYGDAIPVLVTHFALSGMSTPTGLPTSELGEPVLDVHELAEQGWRYVFAGHVHKREHRRVAGLTHFSPSEEPRRPTELDAWSIGSPWRHDFGEESIEPGVILLDTLAPSALVLPLPDRRFVTLELEGVEDGDRVAPLGEYADVEGAIVRVIVKVDEDKAPRVDVDAIRHNLVNLRGAHNVHSIRLDVTRSRRARADVTEDSEPLDALDEWAASQSLDASATERLRELTASLLEGER